MSGVHDVPGHGQHHQQSMMGSGPSGNEATNLEYLSTIPTLRLMRNEKPKMSLVEYLYSRFDTIIF